MAIVGADNTDDDDERDSDGDDDDGDDKDDDDEEEDDRNADEGRFSSRASELMGFTAAATTSSPPRKT